MEEYVPLNVEPKKGKLSDSIILVAVIAFVAWGILLAVVFVLLATRH
jgi:hypothetical protein